MAGNIIFPMILLFLTIFDLTDQLIELTDGNGTGKFVSPTFFVPKQCYGAMGEFAPGSYRIQFRVVGQGHCQLLLCYPSQLDPYAITNGMEPEIGYYLPNNLESNAWMEKCPVTGENEKWHGIYVDVDIDTINLTLSFTTQRFPVKRDFILELANPSYSSLRTKLQIFNLDSEQFEIKEFGNDEKIHQQFLGFHHRGASLANFVGLWTLAMDMLPSDLNKNKIKMFTFASKYNSHPGEHNITCDVDSGKMVEDNCHIQAWFLEPDDKIIEKQITENAKNNSSIMDTTLPFIDESLLENPLQINDTIHITGWVNVKAEGYFRIHLLHNWTEPDSIMGETILSILVRRNYINFESKYNFTKYEQQNPKTISDIINQTLDENIDQKFSLDIVIDENGNFNLTLNCKENAFIFKQTIDPLKYASIDYILIEADSGWELNNYEIKKNKNGPLKPTILPNSNNTILPFSDPSYSLKLEYPTNERDFYNTRDFYIIAKLELKKNANKFDINLVQHDGQQNNGSILLHFHANLNENFYQLGEYNGKIWSTEKFINDSEIVKPLAAGEQFFWIWLQSYDYDKIFIDKTEIYNETFMEGMDRKEPNYIQFKGDLLLLDFNVEPVSKFFPFENAFNPFNRITIILNLVGDEGVTIYFICLDLEDEEKCINGLYSDYYMDLYINENYMSLEYDEQKIEKKVELPYNQTIKLLVYANQFEYQIFNGDKLIFMANYWQFPSPDKFDTIAFNDIVYLPERKPRKEWKQFDSDIALPFSYRLDKPLEIESSIKIKIETDFRVIFNFNMDIYLQHNASNFDEHFGKNVLWMNLHASKDFGLMVTYGRKITDSNFENDNYTRFNDIKKSFDLEIIVHEKFYQIAINGKNRFTFDHLLPIEMVDFVRIEGNNKITEAKITWPSDTSPKWLTAPEHKQIELIGPLDMPKNESIFMRLGQPLRINDAIVFKGKFHNTFIEESKLMSIELLRDITIRDSEFKPFKILKVNIQYYSHRESCMDLSRDTFYDGSIKNDRQNFYINNQEIYVKIHVDENNFVVRINNSTKFSFENAGLFWAVDYIKFVFEEGLKNRNIDMEKGFPKIVHDYPGSHFLVEILRMMLKCVGFQSYNQNGNTTILGISLR